MSSIRIISEIQHYELFDYVNFEQCSNMENIETKTIGTIVECGKYKIGDKVIHLREKFAIYYYPLENLPSIYTNFISRIINNFEMEGIKSDGIILPLSDIGYLSQNSERKLLSIQKVEKVIQHKSADLLENCEVLGWNIVTKMDEAKAGEKVVYCEIDSLLPANASWLPDAVQSRIKQGKITNFNDSQYFRVKSINIRRSLSQGLLIPLTNFGLDESIEIGTNLSDFFGVKRYSRDEDEKISGELFPLMLVDKTDETRIQCKPSILDKMRGHSYYATVKLDGTSATFLYTDKLKVCSRNKIVEDKNSVWWNISERYNFEYLYSEGIINKKYCIQGEICGPKIQKNLLSLKKLEFYIFTVYDTLLKQRLSMDELIIFCKDNGFNMVPLEEICQSFEYDNVGQLLEKAKGFYENTKHPREGLVFRNTDSTISFKVINNEYLLKYE